MVNVFVATYLKRAHTLVGTSQNCHETINALSNFRITVNRVLQMRSRKEMHLWP